MILETTVDRFTDGMLGFLLGMLVTFILAEVMVIIPLMKRQPPGA